MQNQQKFDETASAGLWDIMLTIFLGSHWIGSVLIQRCSWHLAVSALFGMHKPTHSVER